MKTIMCYGDSNTFGSNPHGGRWPIDIRWTGRMQSLLGSEYHVLEEGCGGRTTVWDDVLETYRNGKEYLPAALATHKPIDLVVLMLGTNDLKTCFHTMPGDVANGVKELIEIIQDFPYGFYYNTPQILLVSPIYIGTGIENSTSGSFDQSAVEKSHGLSCLMQEAAKVRKCYFLDAAAYAGPSQFDHLHMEAEDHIALAHGISEMILNIFNKT